MAITGPSTEQTVFVRGSKPKIWYKGAFCNNLESHREVKETYVFFFGIRYAKPLLPGKRFQPPEPFEAPEGILYDATNSGPRCIQINEDRLVGEEDCLYLNVYTPKDPKSLRELLPVLVYFHGGGFQRGTGNIEERTPDSMIKHDIIWVTVNYRLGSLGFLNMHTESCKGNAGLKDQVLALKWIRDNISSFGGDPKNVTISGESAGGSCVNLHLISPLSKGLFHKAIIQSGGIHCPWGYRGRLLNTMRFLKKYGHLQNAKREAAMEVLRTVTPEFMIRLDNEICCAEYPCNKVGVLYGPSLESFPEGAFIPEPIEELLEKSEPVPLLTGITEQEGYMVYEDIPKEGGQFARWLCRKRQLRNFLMVNLNWSKEVAEINAEILRKRYCLNLPGKKIAKLRHNFATFCTDLWFHRFYDNFKFGRRGSAPFYVYKFDYRSEINIFSQYEGKQLAPGHGDDLLYLISHPDIRSLFVPFSPNVQRKIDTICSLWTSFCKTGVPKTPLEDVEWLPHTEENPCYLRIAERLQLIREPLNKVRWDFMRALIEKEQAIPSLPGTPSSRSSDNTVTSTVSTPSCSFEMLSLSDILGCLNISRHLARVKSQSSEEDNYMLQDVQTENPGPSVLPDNMSTSTLDLPKRQRPTDLGTEPTEESKKKRLP